MHRTLLFTDEKTQDGKHVTSPQIFLQIKKISIKNHQVIFLWNLQINSEIYMEN